MKKQEITLIVLFALIPIIIVFALLNKNKIAETNAPANLDQYSQNLQDKFLTNSKTNQAVLQQQEETPMPDTKNLTTVTELQIEDITEGTGLEVVEGNTVTVHYTGTLTDGTKFDSSKDRGVPFDFTVGAGSVIQGWEKGLIGMKVGGVRKLTIPSDMAYGERGSPPVIPGGATLVFEIELLEVN